MTLAPPPPVTTNPIARLLDDWCAEATATVPFPPGDTAPSVSRTPRFAEQSLPVLLTIDGDFHRRSRKAMLPAFHSCCSTRTTRTATRWTTSTCATRS